MLKKILLTIGSVIVILIIGLVIMVNMISSANKEKDANEEIMKSKNNTKKIALIVYQPAALSDITSTIAHKIAKGLNDGGYEVVLNYPGSKLSTDISKYSVVVFGSPTYAGEPLSIVTDYMSKVKNFASKRVVLYVTGGNEKEKTELDVMEKSLKDIKPYKKVKFLKSSKDDNNAYALGKELSKD